MNAGLGNLSTLKRHLLTAGMAASSTDFNPVIADIGRGVARLFDSICNREFTYAENYTEIFMGNRAFWYVKKYPFVQVAKIELKYFQTDEWTDITTQPLIVNPETGQLNFGYLLGPAPLQVRATYTGGYWYQTIEEGAPGYLVCNDQTDAGYPAALPASIQGSPNLNPPGIEPFKFLLPYDLRLAWLTQCRRVWDSFDKLGLGLTDKPGAQTSVSEVSIAPEVRSTLERYVRYQAS